MRNLRELFWPIIFGLIFGTAMYFSVPAHADDNFLSGSDNALVLGPSGYPDPADYPGYLPTIDSDYLQPDGYTGTIGSVQALVTPETSDYGPSVTQGEQDLVTAVESDYNAHDFSAADPLTLVGYSQSAVVIGDAEPTLADYGIPEEDLRILLMGDTASAEGGFLNTTAEQPMWEQLLNDLGWSNLIGNTTPDNLYPTEVYTLNNDYWACQTCADPNQAIHQEYLGLTPAELADHTAVTEGLTTYFTVTDPANMFETLYTAFTNLF